MVSQKQFETENMEIMEETLQINTESKSITKSLLDRFTKKPKITDFNPSDVVNQLTLITFKRYYYSLFL